MKPKPKRPKTDPVAQARKRAQREKIRQITLANFQLSIGLVTRAHTGALANRSINSLKADERRGLLVPIKCGPKIVSYSAANVAEYLAGRGASAS